MAVAASVGLHALLGWAVSSAERPAEPLPRTLPLAAYLVPMPPEPLEAPLRELPPEEEPPNTAPEPAPEPETPEPESTPADAPAEQQVEAPPADPDEAEAIAAEDVRRPVRAAPERREIDWNLSISRAIARVREQEQRQAYHSFGRAVPLPDTTRPAGQPAKRLEPWESQRPGETIATGTQQVLVNENCYYEVYAPGSLLEEAHRFSNSLLNCKPSGPAEPRNDLFIDARPAYLDLHLAEDEADEAQRGP